MCTLHGETPLRLKIFLTPAILIFLLTACNLTSPEIAPTVSATDTPQVLPTEADTVPEPLPATATASPASTVTAVPLQLTVASTQAQGSNSSVVPIGVRTTVAPNPPTVSPPTAASTSDQTPSGGATATLDIPFPTIFPSEHTVSLNTGRTLIVEYDVTIYNPGTGRVFLKVLDPTGKELHRMVITATEKSSVDIPVATSGEHTILAAPENLSGSYTVAYGFR